LPFRQEEIALRGHAIECRMYAEDPDNNFFPSPGKIVDCRVPTGPGIRLDEGIYAGWTVPNEYDPMLGKLIAWGGDREEALARMGRALEGYYASGIKTNVSLFRRILASSDFQKGAIYTRWLDDFLSAERVAEPRGGEEESRIEQATAIAAFLWHTSRAGGANAADTRTDTGSRWKTESRREQVNREPQR
jgi:acetyl-CoA carboxylase biotin carboxylase subunit